MTNTSHPFTSWREQSKEEPSGKSNPSFDIIQYCKDAHIQVSPLDYFKSNPIELQKLVDYFKWETGNITHPNANSTISNDQPSTSTYSTPDEEPILPMLFKEEESSILATSPG